MKSQKGKSQENYPQKCRGCFGIREPGFSFQSAFHFKGIHERFIAMHCQRTQENLETAKAQLDIVMPISLDLKQAALELMDEMTDKGGSV